MLNVIFTEKTVKVCKIGQVNHIDVRLTLSNHKFPEYRVREKTWVETKNGL